jgi:hypothetical protein
MRARYLLLALAALSCTDPSAPTPQGALLGGLPLPPPPPLPISLDLVRCEPSAYDSVTQTVGPGGGTIQVGTTTLSVPAGALDSAVSITAVVPSDTVNHVRFEPQGLTFLQPASLTMSYANCNTKLSTDPRRIAYTTEALQILEYLPSVDDASIQTVTGELHHFSDYAIAW